MASPFKQQGQGGQYLSKARRQRHQGNMLQTVFQGAKLIEMAINSIGRSRSNKAHKAAMEEIYNDEVSGALQNAQLGTLEDAIAMGLVIPGRECFGGYYLGMMEGYPVIYRGDQHIAVQGPSGSGKSNRFGKIAMLTRGMRGPGWRGESIVFTNLKKQELLKAVGDGCSTIDDVEITTIDHLNEDETLIVYINPMSGLIKLAQDGRKHKDLVRAFIHKVWKVFKAAMEGNNSWISTEAQELATMLAVEWCQNDEGRAWLGAFWDFSQHTHDNFVKEMEILKKSTAGDGYVATKARKLADKYNEWSEQWEWVMENMAHAFDLYSKGSIVREKRKFNQFDAAFMTQKQMSVSINVPVKLNETHGADLSLIIESMMADVVAVPEEEMNHNVCFFIDEFSNVSMIPSLKLGFKLFREEGCRIVTIVQDRNSYAQYKEQNEISGHETFEVNAIQLLWGVKGQQGKEIQEEAGYRTVKSRARNAGYGVQADSGGHSMSEQTTPNLPAQEIASQFLEKGTLIIQDKVFVLDRVHWDQLEFVREYIK